MLAVAPTFPSARTLAKTLAAVCLALASAFAIALAPAEPAHATTGNSGNGYAKITWTGWSIEYWDETHAVKYELVQRNSGTTAYTAEQAYNKGVFTAANYNSTTQTITSSAIDDHPGGWKLAGWAKNQHAVKPDYTLGQQIDATDVNTRLTLYPIYERAFYSGVSGTDVSKQYYNPNAVGNQTTTGTKYSGVTATDISGTNGVYGWQLEGWVTDTTTTSSPIATNNLAADAADRYAVYTRNVQMTFDHGFDVSGETIPSETMSPIPATPATQRYYSGAISDKLIPLNVTVNLPAAAYTQRTNGQEHYHVRENDSHQDLWSITTYSSSGSTVSADQAEGSTFRWSPQVQAKPSAEAVVAHWDPSVYTITYYANNGENNEASEVQTVAVGVQHALLAACPFTKSGGYYCTGWNTLRSPTNENQGVALELGYQLVLGADGLPTINGASTAHITLYAQWRPVIPMPLSGVGDWLDYLLTAGAIVLAGGIAFATVKLRQKRQRRET